MTSAELAQAARGLVGVPFRLHGRDPLTGLDCIGVLEAACRACGVTARLPSGYPLRSRALPPLDPMLRPLGLAEASGPARPGAVLIVRPGPCQHHLIIATGPDRYVHAHAALRRVAEGPVPAHWPVAGHWHPLS